jgi:hypothetical protein
MVSNVLEGKNEKVPLEETREEKAQPYSFGHLRGKPMHGAGQEWVVGPLLKARFWVLQSLWID